MRLLTILLCCATLCLHAQVKEIDGEKLKGRVKNAFVYFGGNRHDADMEDVYTYCAFDNSVTYYRIGCNGRDGYVLRKNANDTFVNDTFLEKEVFVYNDDGTLDISYRYNGCNIRDQSIYKYDENGREIEKDVVNPRTNKITEKTLRVNKPEGNKALKYDSSMMPPYAVYNKTYSFFDKHSNDTEDDIYRNGEIAYKNIFKYDVNGDKIEKIAYDYFDCGIWRIQIKQKEVINMCTDSQYDDKGNVVIVKYTKEIKGDTGNYLEQIRVNYYDYVYDKQGNWISKCELDDGEILHSGLPRRYYITRVIEYY